VKTKTNRHAELIDLFTLVLNKFSALEKIPWDFGTGDKLFPSEIHVVDAIGRRQNIKMTDLAFELGISKPAVTQMIARVIKKNLVERHKGEGNMKEVLLRLTESGRIAFRGHQEFHRRMDVGIMDRLGRLTYRERDFVCELFEGIASYFDRAIEERKGPSGRSGEKERRR
jgi:DNA-binding MarR family transcriptional regulator